MLDANFVQKPLLDEARGERVGFAPGELKRFGERVSRSPSSSGLSLCQGRAMTPSRRSSSAL